ncbi:MAG: lysylphosphatidylglycerol synthase domain-containing protein, partial [Bacteroidota bacterium]
RIWGWIEQNNVLGDKLANIQGILIGGTIVGLLVVFFVWRNRKRLAQKAIFAKIFGLIAGFAEGLKTILKLDRPWLFVFHSINIWVMYYLMTYLCLFAFAPTANLGLVAALIVFVAGGWGIVVPSPGGMGSYHFMTQAALTLYGIAGDDAFSWSNIAFFTINLGCNVAIGLLALLVLPRINADYHPNPALVEAK